MNVRKKLGAVKDLVRRASKSQFFRSKFRVVKYSKKYSINEKLVLFEAFMGNDFTGNPFYVFEHMYNNKEYDDFKKVIAVNKAYISKVEALIKRYGYTKNVKIIMRNAPAYCKALTTAKYLVNNVSFPTYFVKKEGQIFLNTWHGTPLKGLGRSIKDNPNSIGNVQRNFLMCDYLLYPNRYSYEHIREDYMLEQLYKGDYVLAGYPCNSKFFENSRADDIRKSFGVEGKRVIVYMPTWRDVPEGSNENKQIDYTAALLKRLDESLDDDTVVFVKMHHLAKDKISVDGFEKIREFPSDYETYDFLSIADSLITDYSSVMFDFANTGKSIYLYTYDKDEYMAGRSMYFDISELPFFASGDLDELVNEIRQNKTYDYKAFVDEYCEFDCRDAAKNLTELLIYGKKSDNMELVHGSDLFNGRENVMIYTGVLQKNGMTTALKNLVSTLDAQKRNYVLTFYANKTDGAKALINEFPKDIAYMPILGNKNLTFFEGIAQILYYMNFNPKIVQKAIDRIYRREWERLYPCLHFDHVIHFTGYERHIMQLLGRSDAKKHIWVHNNMFKEAQAGKNLHINSVKYAYSTFDSIVIVRDTMREELVSFMNENEQKKIRIVHNQNDVKAITQKAEADIEFQEDETYCNVSLERLNEILDNDSIDKFINIARFSKEKGMDRLITAFDKYRQEYDDTAYLIIIGGYGSEFENISSMVEQRDNIILIKSIENPYPILKKCDAFVLSSYYEGLPMTIIEALILNVPVISTNITGPREFLQAGYGYLVDDSEQGIIDGLAAYKNGKLAHLTEFDVLKFNADAMSEFEALFE